MMGLPVAWIVWLLVLVAPSWAGVAAPADVSGRQKLLVVAVRFADVEPMVSLQDIETKSSKVNRYLQAASYGKVSLSARLTGWYQLPGKLADYRVSPHNYQVERWKVRKLLSEALGAARADGADPSAFDQVWIVVGARTQPGKGYGMIAYCANPGLLTEDMRRGIYFEKVDLAGGGSYRGPAVVSAENAHVGHVAHDLLHALGGAKDGKRAVADLYDFYLQSNPPVGVAMTPALFAIHAGPWGIMSQHFIARTSPPPLPLAFTRIQLGWIKDDQIVDLQPGEERQMMLYPLASGKGTLVVRIRLSATKYLLLENRQPISADASLPAFGLVVSRINEKEAEGGGIVKVVDSTPATKTLDDAPFIPEDPARNVFKDDGLDIGVVVLSKEDSGNLGILVTSAERAHKPPN